MGEASFGPDGSCRLTDASDGTEVMWASARRWALAWFRERGAKEHGDASDFIGTACGDAVAGVVDALIVLAEVAEGDAALLGWVGSGPLEDLVSHSGHGLQVLAEVDRAARQNKAFRAALGHVWLGADVPEPVRARLSELGATVLEGS